MNILENNDEMLICVCRIYIYIHILVLLFYVIYILPYI